ncbi:translation initiation factor IF-3 [Candidatus Peregrinibacteria bacterium]|nr:MAG: translation initiation factor IF-3 [Candidatus Peregrinibacteria bacterium]
MRLIAEEGEEIQGGVMGASKALALAKEMGLDLVEVSPTVFPPVCRIMDFGKYLYRQRKADQKHKAHQKGGEMKGVRLSIRTDKHDIDVKLNKCKEFLKDGNSLKFSLIFRGREVTHIELGFEKMNYVKEELKDFAKIDQDAKRQGHSLIMILSPLK